MTRTFRGFNQIKQDSITGANTDSNIGIFDETANYSAGDIVFWDKEKYTAGTAIVGGTLGDLTNNPSTSANWGKTHGFLGISADYASTEDWIFQYMEFSLTGDIEVTFPASFSNWKTGDIKFFQSLRSNTDLVVLDLNGNSVEGDSNNIVIAPGGYLELQYRGGSDLIVLRSKGISKEFTPADLPNLEFWIDANDSSSFTLSGTTITAVTEKSPNTHATVAVGGTPQLQTGQVNGKNAIYFDGTDDYFDFGDVELHNNGAGRGLHIYAVALPIATGDTIISKYRTSGDQREWLFRTGDTIIYENGDQSGNEARTGTDMIIGDWSVGELKWGAAGKSQFFLNGGLRENSVNVVNDIEDTGADLRVGVMNGTQNDMNGHIAEIVVTSRPLTSSEQAQMNEYFSNKYDLSVWSPTFIPRTLTVEASINGNLAADGYLNRSDGTPTDTSPFILPFNATLTAMSAGTQAGVNETWTCRVRRNGTNEYNLALTARDSRFTGNLARGYTAGDRISVFAELGSSGALDYPQAVIVFKERQ